MTRSRVVTQCKTNAEWAERMNARRQGLPAPVTLHADDGVWVFTPVWREVAGGIEQCLGVEHSGESRAGHGLWEFYRVASKVLAQTPRG